jgi:hypothetical protein
MQHRPYNNGTPVPRPSHAPFKPGGRGPQRSHPQRRAPSSGLEDRKRLLASLDQFRRDADGQRMMDGSDAYTEQAFGVLTSSRLAKALDLSQEDSAVRERYGTGTTAHQGDGAPRINAQFLLARRLVEAGVRCVTFSYSFWDWHGGTSRTRSATCRTSTRR